jgi:peroxiredoxin
VLATLGLVLLLAGNAAGDGAATERKEPPRIGDVVPDFEATSLQGEPLSLKTAVAGHKAVVVVFVSALCPYAKYFAPHLREIEERYGPRGVMLVGVNANRWESTEEAAQYAEQRGLAFPMVKDDEHAIAERLGARATPEAFLLDSEGRLRYRGWVKSRQESPDLQRALDAVLAGRPVRRPETKAFGCAVDHTPLSTASSPAPSR